MMNRPHCWMSLTLMRCFQMLEYALETKTVMASHLEVLSSQLSSVAAEYVLNSPDDQSFVVVRVAI